MSNRVVMVDDLFALIDGVKQWIENQLADGAGTKTTTFGTSAGVVDGSDRASVAATTSPPSAGTTASGDGSVAAAVEALSRAIAAERKMFPDSWAGGVYLETRRAAEKTTGDKPCPTQNGARADTGAESAGSTAGGSKTESTNQTTTARASTTTPGTDSAPPPTEEEKNVSRVRSMLAEGPSWSNWIPSPRVFGLLSAYDAERVRLALIAAILSDDSLENPQKIGRALRVAEEQA